MNRGTKSIMRGKLSWAVLAIGSAALALAGCGDDPVTTPDGEPLVFTGQLTEGGTSEVSLELVEEGTVRIVLTDATPLLIEIPEGFNEAFFSVGVGVGDTDTGDCVLTFGDSLLEGDALTVLMEGTDKCLLVFDDGTLPDDAVISYTLTVEDVES